MFLKGKHSSDLDLVECRSFPRITIGTKRWLILNFNLNLSQREDTWPPGMSSEDGRRNFLFVRVSPDIDTSL